MSFLEDRIARIMELRRQEWDDEKIAAELDVPVKLVGEYEAAVKKTIVATAKESTSLRKAAKSSGLSVAMLRMFAQLYDVDLASIVGSSATDTPVPSKAPKPEEIPPNVHDALTKPVDYALQTGFALEPLEVRASDMMWREGPPTELHSPTATAVLKLRHKVAWGMRDVYTLARAFIRSPGDIRRNVKKGHLRVLDVPKDKYHLLRGNAFVSLEDTTRAVDYAIICGHGRHTEDLALFAQDLAFRTGGTLSYDTADTEPFEMRHTIAWMGYNGEEIPGFGAKQMKDAGFSRILLLYHGRMCANFHRPEIDMLAREGLPKAEIGRRVGITIESVNQYLGRSRQRELYKVRHAAYKEKRNAAQRKKEQKQARAHIIAIVKERAIQLAHEESWAMGKTIERYLSKRKAKNSVPFEHVLNVFKRYEEARDSGVKLSIAELAEGIPIGPSHVAKILHSAGVEPMYWSHGKKVTPKAIKEAIDRIHWCSMTAPDIAYFVGVENHVVAQRWANIGKRPWVKGILSQDGFEGRNHRLSYRIASQVYEADDAGFNLEEMAQYADTTTNLVERALDRREKYESTIVQTLRVLFPEREITKPYL